LFITKVNETIDSFLVAEIRAFATASTWNIPAFQLKNSRVSGKQEAVKVSSEPFDPFDPFDRLRAGRLRAGKLRTGSQP
jgi:hypothetical protein